MSVGVLGSIPLDPEALELLDQFRRSAHALEELVQRRNDAAAMHDLAAGVNRRLAKYVLSEANQTIPPVTPDRPGMAL